MPVTAEHVCPDCGASLGSDALADLCPACLLQSALAESSIDSRMPSFPDHEIIEEIGRGGMGIIYRALQISLNRLVALKMIQGVGWTDEQSLRRFRAEAEAVASLDHPNIIPIHEVGEFEGVPYFTMKLVEGGSLAANLGKFSNAQRCAELIIRIAQAIHYAHTRGVLHRDLKPGNVLLDHEGAPYVTDFGLAKRFDDDGQFTRTDALMGTPAYMAPEQAEAPDGELSTATDVYSLGAIFYQLLTGRAPFAEKTPLETMKAVVEREPPLPRSLCPDVPRDLETICLKCLAKDPKRRYPSALELAEDLERWRLGKPITARSTTTIERMAMWAGRNPASATLLGVVVLAVGGFVALLEHSRSNLRVERDHAQAQEAIARDALALMDYQLADAAFEQEDAATAMAYLASVLRRDPSNHVAAERLLFALSHRQFALPAARPFQHEAPVIAAEFGPEDEFVMTASRDGVVKFRRLDSNERPQSLTIGFPIRSAALSRNGEAFMVGGMNGEVEIWSLSERKRKHRFDAHGTPVTHVEFDSTGLRALSHAGGIEVAVMDALGGDVLCVINGHQRAALFACFSPDGRMVLTGGADDTARLWEADTGTAIGKPLQHTDFVNDGCFSPDGRRVATADDRHLVHIWDLSGQRVVGPIKHYRPVLSVRYSNDGARLVTGQRYEQRVRVWDANTGKALSDAMRVNGNVTWAGFSPRGLRIASLSSGNTVQLWDGFDYRRLGEPIVHDQPVESVRFSRNGNFLLTTSHGNAARLWDIRFYHPHKVSFPNFNAINEAAFSPDGESVATASTDGLIVVWNSATGQRRWHRDGHDSRVHDLNFSPDGSLLGTTSWDNRAIIWDAVNGRKIAELPLGAAGKGVEFNPASDRVVTIADNGQARIWHPRTGERLVTIRHAEFRLSVARFDSTGKRLVSASFGYARVWDPQTGKPLTPPMRHDGMVMDAVFDSTGARIATGAQDSTARVWDAATGEPLTPPLEHGDTVRRVRFSPDDHLLVTGDEDNSARVWNVASGTAVTEKLRHEYTVWDGEFDRHSRRVVTGSTMGNSRLWDVETGLPLSPKLHHNASVWVSEFHPQRTEFLSAGWSRTAKLWAYDEAETPVPNWFPQLAEALAGKRLDESRRMVTVDSGALPALQKSVPELAGSDSAIDRWGRWFFADPHTRTLTHRNNVTIASHLDVLRQNLSLKAAREIVMRGSLDPDDWRRLAYFTLREATGDGTRRRTEAATYEDHAASLPAAGSNTAELPIKHAALHFDGRASYLSAPHIPFDDYDEFTIEAWVCDWERALFCQGNHGDPENTIWATLGEAMDAGTFWESGWETGRGTDHCLPLPVPEPFRWHHVAIVSGGGQLRLYLDGKPVGSRPSPKPGPFRRNRRFFIGSHSGVGDTYLGHGFLRSFRISNQARYESKFIPESTWEPDAHTELLYRFDEPAEDLAVDLSGHQRHGKLHQTRWFPARGK